MTVKLHSLAMFDLIEFSETLGSQAGGLPDGEMPRICAGSRTSGTVTALASYAGPVLLLDN